MIIYNNYYTSHYSANTDFERFIFALKDNDIESVIELEIHYTFNNTSYVDDVAQIVYLMIFEFFCR